MYFIYRLLSKQQLVCQGEGVISYIHGSSSQRIKFIGAGLNSKSQKRVHLWLKAVCSSYFADRPRQLILFDYCPACSMRQAGKNSLQRVRKRRPRFRRRPSDTPSDMSHRRQHKPCTQGACFRACDIPFHKLRRHRQPIWHISGGTSSPPLPVAEVPRIPPAFR